MTEPRRLQIAPEIVHETIQGEVVVIDLESGCYYSLSGAAADVWARLQQPATLEDVVEALSARYAAAAGEIETAVSTFFESLESEGLVVAAPDGAAGLQPLAAADHATAGAPFVAPALQKYSDMQDLLQIDPIHEVGEAGWPARGTPEN
jgi:hypothetical protein